MVDKKEKEKKVTYRKEKQETSKQTNKRLYDFLFYLRIMFLSFT